MALSPMSASQLTCIKPGRSPHGYRELRAGGPRGKISTASRQAFLSVAFGAQVRPAAQLLAWRGELTSVLRMG